MYKLVTIRDVVRVDPRDFSKNLEEVVLKNLRKKYEGVVDKDTGVVITVINPRDISEGIITPGDGGTYHRVTCDLVVFKPEINEVIKGKVSDITEFGAFVRFGPMEGLVHISQITDDYMSYNEKTGVLAGKESKKVLKKGDVVLARITGISLKEKLTDCKISLTMRQEGLGKIEWIRAGGKK